MDIEEDVKAVERGEARTSGNRTKRNSSRMRETPIAIRPSFLETSESKAADKKLQVVLQRCEVSKEIPKENRPLESAVADDEEPQFDAIDEERNTSRSPIVCKSKRMVQTTINFPSQKKAHHSKKKTTSSTFVRPGTPDFIQQPKSRLAQPKEMQIIASDSEAETNHISPEIVESIRNLSKLGPITQEEFPRKVAVSKKRRISVQPANIVNPPKKSKTENLLSQKRSLYSIPSCSDEEDDAMEANKASSAEPETPAVSAFQPTLEASHRDIEEENFAQTSENEVEAEVFPVVEAEEVPPVVEAEEVPLVIEATQTPKPSKAKKLRKQNSHKAVQEREKSVEAEEEEHEHLDEINAASTTQRSSSSKEQRQRQEDVQVSEDNFEEPQKVATPTKTTKKKGKKTKQAPPAKPSRRFERVVVYSDSEEESDSGVERDPYFKYDPKEQGCQRDGLRIRKYARPRWMPGPSGDNVAVIYTYGTLKELGQEYELRRQMKKHKVTHHQLMPNHSIDSILPPAVNLKRIENIVKERARLQKADFVKGRRQKDREPVNEMEHFVETVKKKIAAAEKGQSAVAAPSNFQNG